MPALKLLRHPHGSYQGEHVPGRVYVAGTPRNPAKPEGDKHDGIVDVSDAGAAYLLSTFPDSWAEVKAEEPAEKPAEKKAEKPAEKKP